MSELASALLTRLMALEARVQHLETLEYPLRSTLGTDGGFLWTYIAPKQVADGVATPVFSITTTNETGDADAGSYSAWVLAQATHSNAPTSSVIAAIALT